MSVGVLAAFLLYLRRFFEPMQDLSQFYTQFQGAARRAGEAGGRARRGAGGAASPRTRWRCPSRRATLSFEHVNFAYKVVEILPGPHRRHPRGRDARARGRDGRGQDHDRAPDGALLRPDVGTRHARRRRPARPLRRRAPPRGGDGHPGQLPVLRHRRRQHRLRPTRRVTRRDRGRGQGHRRARLHLRAARRLRHRHPEAWRAALGRAAPAGRVRPRVPRPARGADPRRGHVVARHPERTAGAERAAHPARRTAPR